MIELHAVEGLPEVAAGDDLAALVAERFRLVEDDIVVVAQKVVSKAEGQVRRLGSVVAGERAQAIAARTGHDARFVQLVLDESVRVLRDERVLVVETRHGYVCANAGIDTSNVPGDDCVTLLPRDSDASAQALRARFRELTGAAVGVVVADTFGRAWRNGIANVALGAAGVAALVDYRGVADDHGRELHVTVVAVADELAAAAELVMGKVSRVPVAVVRGYRQPGPHGTGRELVRPPELDLFR